MAVTDQNAIRFCDQIVRQAADRLAGAYYHADAAGDRWSALGGGQPAIDQMEADIRSACNRIIELYEFCFRAEKIWFLGLNVTITNDASEVFDGPGLTAPDPYRPLMTGAKVHALMGRVVELQNWLLSLAGSFSDATRVNAAYYNTALSASTWGPVTLTVADAGNAINRFGELRTNYEANSSANLGTILAVAVNPNN